MSDPGKNLSSLTVIQLKEQLKVRLLSTTGTKSCLAARLSDALKNDGLDPLAKKFYNTLEATEDESGDTAPAAATAPHKENDCLPIETDLGANETGGHLAAGSEESEEERCDMNDDSATQRHIVDAEFGELGEFGELEDVLEDLPAESCATQDGNDCTENSHIALAEEETDAFEALATAPSDGILGNELDAQKEYDHDGKLGRSVVPLCASVPTDDAQYVETEYQSVETEYQSEDQISTCDGDLFQTSQTTPPDVDQDDNTVTDGQSTQMGEQQCSNNLINVSESMSHSHYAENLHALTDGGNDDVNTSTNTPRFDEPAEDVSDTSDKDEINAKACVSEHNNGSSPRAGNSTMDGGLNPTAYGNDTQPSAVDLTEPELGSSVLDTCVTTPTFTEDVKLEEASFETSSAFMQACTLSGSSNCPDRVDTTNDGDFANMEAHNDDSQTLQIHAGDTDLLEDNNDTAHVNEDDSAVGVNEDTTPMAWADVPFSPKLDEDAKAPLKISDSSLKKPQSNNQLNERVCCSVWVSNLSPSTKAADLKRFVSKFYKVMVAKIVMNTKAKIPKCFGLVLLTSSVDADDCITKLHRSMLHGKTIYVAHAKPDMVCGILQQEGVVAEDPTEVPEGVESVEEGRVGPQAVITRPVRPANRAALRPRECDREADRSRECDRESRTSGSTPRYVPRREAAREDSGSGRPSRVMDRLGPRVSPHKHRDDFTVVVNPSRNDDGGRRAATQETLPSYEAWRSREDRQAREARDDRQAREARDDRQAREARDDRQAREAREAGAEQRREMERLRREKRHIEEERARLEAERRQLARDKAEAEAAAREAREAQEAREAAGRREGRERAVKRYRDHSREPAKRHAPAYHQAEWLQDRLGGHERRRSQERETRVTRETRRRRSPSPTERRDRRQREDVRDARTDRHGRDARHIRDGRDCRDDRDSRDGRDLVDAHGGAVAALDYGHGRLSHYDEAVIRLEAQQRATVEAMMMRDHERQLLAATGAPQSAYLAQSYSDTARDSGYLGGAVLSSGVPVHPGMAHPGMAHPGMTLPGMALSSMGGALSLQQMVERREREREAASQAGAAAGGREMSPLRRGRGSPTPSGPVLASGAAISGAVPMFLGGGASAMFASMGAGAANSTRRY